MPTQYDDLYMTITHHDGPCQQTYGNFNSFRQSSEDFMADVDDKNEWMDDVDYDNICKIQKEVQDQFNSIADTQQVDTRSTFILKSSDEQILSQKFTQLSTTTVHEQPLMMKDIEDKLKSIPDFLIKRNQSFQHMLHQAFSNNTNNQNDIYALRHIAILIYKITLLQMYQILWITYFKSGMGQLIVQSQDRPMYSTHIGMWPKQIKTLIQSTTMNKTVENEACMAFVNNHIRQLDMHLKQYELQLKNQTTNFYGYTLTIQQIIEAYIKQNLLYLHKEIEHQIELIHYDYHIQALKLEYFRLKPNTYQEQLMKQICQSVYEQEITEQEYHFLKQQIAYYNLPNQSFDSSSISHSLCIDSIQNTNVRQTLFKQFKNIAEQSRATLFSIYLKSAEDQREQYKKKYEADRKKIFSSQNSSNDNERLSPIMIHLINERCTKISERIKSTYRFKVQSFLSKSNI